MALETCFRVSTIGAPSTPAAAASTKFAHAHYLPHPRPTKLQLPTCRAPRAAAAFFFSPSTPPSPSQHRRGRRGGRLVCEAKNAVAEVLSVTEATWGNLVTEQKDKVVLVDFWAPWCGPCRMIAPIIDELAREYAGKVVCLKLNTDESPGVANQFGIRSIPTVLFFKNGEKKESVIGAVPKSTLSAAIDKYLEL